VPTATLIAEKATWRIPSYAQDMLVVQQGAQHCRTRGPRGEFVLETRTPSVTLRWGTPEGPPLAHLQPHGEPLSASWDGSIVIGGAVSMFQVEEVRGLPLVIAHIEGAPVNRALVARPDLHAMRQAPPELPDVPLSAAEIFPYSVIAEADSALADYFFQALALGLGVVCTARLGPEAGEWHEVSGLPLLAEKLALLPAPIF